MSMPEPTHSKGRLAYLDGLRGLAALAVTLEHLYNAVRATPDDQLVPAPLHTLLIHGGRGVEVFFVLSGYVIAMSVGRTRISARYFGRFALRRSLRLDPPYWIAILVYLAAAKVMGKTTYDDLSLSDLAANFVYLNHLLDIYPAVIQVGWTLCIEIQFYLAFVLFVWLAQAAGSRLSPALYWTVLAAPLGISCAWQLGAFVDPPGYEVFFLQPWYLFALGVATNWVIEGRLPTVTLWTLWVICVTASALQGELAPIVGGAASVTIWLMARKTPREPARSTRQPLTTSLVYLGHISYSLYLLHPLVGSRPIRTVLARLAEASDTTRLALFAAGLCSSIALAHVFHRVVERPSIRLSRRIVVDHGTPATASPQMHA